MLTIYTAVGHLKFQKSEQAIPLPIIINNAREYGLSKEELNVWSCLAFQILTYPELENIHQKHCQTSGITPALPLSHYLNRLLIRGLVVKGSGISGVDAVYRLLGTLTVTPVDNRFFIRLSTGLRLLLKGEISAKTLYPLLKKTPCTPMEQMILSLSKRNSLSAAELLICVEQGKVIHKEADIIDMLYTSPDDTYDTLTDHVQLSHTQYPVLQAISNLYLKQQILFQKL